MTSRTPRILSIAGTDPTGGAGSQADTKAITSSGGFAYAVTTAVLAQNTQGVQHIHQLGEDVLRQQLESVQQDCDIDAIKIGMLGTPGTVQIVKDFLANHTCPVVLDPVMVAASGDRLSDDSTVNALLDVLPAATIITPNIPELEIIAGLEADSITSFEQACEAAQAVARRFGTTVTVKGGHLTGAELPNALVTAEGVAVHTTSPRVETTNSHGTGCSFSSALATRLGMGESPADALRWTVKWIDEALAHADALQVGQGNGPIDHAAQLRRMASAGSNQPWLAARVGDQLHELVESGVDLQGKDEDPLLTAQLTPAGPWTAALWQLSKPLLRETWELPFIQGLRNGTLSTEDFIAYQKQDAIYLNRYSQALAYLAAKAPVAEERTHWSAMSTFCITAELELHKSWLGTERTGDYQWLKDLPATPITMGYTDFLIARAAGDSYPIGVAAVLPCAWLYAEIGLQLLEYNTPDHPYNSWLSMYGDQDFLDAARKDIALTEKILEESNREQRNAAAAAFLGATEWEREFFDQTSRLDLRPPQKD